MLARLADAFVLQPTTDTIPTEGKTRKVVEFDGGRFEVWVQQTKRRPADDTDLFILKFPGTGGRAERMSEHPAEVWEDLSCEIWSVNPPGYGGSGGRASLRNVQPVVKAVHRELSRRAAGRPILVTANSLGSLAALTLVAHHEAAGLLLRNPPPLKQLIAGQYRRRSFGMAKFIAKQVPSNICSLANAARCRQPALFVMSAEDRVVPPSYQQQIVDAYAGDRRVMLVEGADHATPIDESQIGEYVEHLDWLRASFIESCR